MFDILKRIFIGVAIAMCVWFIKSTCFAITISSAQSRLKWNANGTSTDGTYVNFNTNMSINVPSSSSTEYDLTRLFVRWNTSGTGFASGSLYKFIFYWTSSPVRPYADVSYINYSFSTGSHGSCNTSFNNTDQIFTTSCNVTFDSALSSITIGVIPSFPRLINGTTYTARVGSSYSITDIGSNSVQESIYDVGNELGSDLSISNQNTTDIKTKTSIIANYVEELRNALVPLIPDWDDYLFKSQGWLHDIFNIMDDTLNTGSSYNDYQFTESDPRTTDYQNQHNSLSSAGGSGTGSNGSGGLSFDTSYWSNASTGIWGFITNFLSSSSILLPYLFAILTLGFVKVVLNR